MDYRKWNERSTSHKKAQIQQGERVEHYETVRCHKDGGLVDVSLTISPIRDRTGRIIGVSKIAHDITKQMSSATAGVAVAVNARTQVITIRQPEEELGAKLSSSAIRVKPE